MCKNNKMQGSGMFGFSAKKDKVTVASATKTEFSVKEKCRKIQKKLKKTEKQKTEVNEKEKTIWWNQCSSCKYYLVKTLVVNKKSVKLKGCHFFILIIIFTTINSFKFDSFLSLEEKRPLKGRTCYGL